MFFEILKIVNVLNLKDDICIDEENHNILVVANIFLEDLIEFQQIEFK